jgi:hypothetical protein
MTVIERLDPIASNAGNVRHDRPESAIILKKAAHIANANMNK